MIPLRDNVKSKSIPWINYILVAINVYAFISLSSLPSPELVEKYIYRNAIIPLAFIGDPLANLKPFFSSLFLHGSWFHLIGNMVFLHIFGDNVEDKFGHIAYAFFYLFCGVCASLFQIYISSESTIPMIGASGAIAGVLGAYIIFFPGAKVLTLVPFGFFTQIVEIPAFIFLGIWFIMQTFSGTSALYLSKAMGRDPGGIAWWAHAGGFISGAAVALLSFIIRTFRNV